MGRFFDLDSLPRFQNIRASPSNFITESKKKRLSYGSAVSRDQITPCMTCPVQKTDLGIMIINVRRRDMSHWDVREVTGGKYVDSVPVLETDYPLRIASSLIDARMCRSSLFVIHVVDMLQLQCDDYSAPASLP